jgi:hypothetical protein
LVTQGSILVRIEVQHQSSLPGLTRQSISLRKKMDARVKAAHDNGISGKGSA